MNPLQWLRGRRDVDRDLADELNAHLDARVEELVDAGVPSHQARQQARRELGNTTLLVERGRDVWRLGIVEDACQDLRYASRQLRRAPAFATVAILTLGVGIGANTAIFGLIDAVLLRPMPVFDPQQLMQVTRTSPDSGRLALSYPLYEYLRDGSSETFTGTFAQTTNANTADIDVHGTTDSVDVALVTGSYHTLLGLTPAAGRLLNDADDVPGGARVAVISDGYWQRAFARDPSAIGATFSVNGTPVTIVGVTPSGFTGTLPGTNTDVTFPLSMRRIVLGGNDSWRQRDGFNFLSVMARLRPGVTREAAAVQLAVRFASRLPAGDRETGQAVGLQSAASGFDDLRVQFLRPLLILMALVGLVLLLVSVNLSSLLLAKAEARQREIAVRCAIGAGRGRLLRQFLAEGLVLASLGGAAGVVLAIWFSSALVAMMANGDTLSLSTTPDWRVVAFVGIATLAACVLVAAVPAFHAIRVVPLGAQVVDARGTSRRTLGKSLVVGQIAISFLLLVGAALFVGTLIKLYTMDAGFRRDGILTFTLAGNDRPNSPRRQAIESELLQRIGHVPGVASTSAMQVLFISGGSWNGPVSVEGYEAAPDEDPRADFNAVAPGFFETTGTTLVGGRDFDEQDRQAATGADQASPLPDGEVAIINEAFAKAYLQGRSPIGRAISIAGAPRQYKIVGIVKDAKYHNLRERFPKTVYFPLGANRFRAPTLLVHTNDADPTWVLPEVRRALRDLDATMRLDEVRTFAEQIDRSILTERIMATLAAFFGVVALVIASLGIFGVMAFHVAQRTREFGIRLALGATRGAVAALVLRDALLVLFLGCSIGGMITVPLSRIVQSLLFGVTPTDPGVVLVAIATLGVVGVGAGYAPAWRAARVNPNVALRPE